MIRDSAQLAFRRAFLVVSAFADWTCEFRDVGGGLLILPDPFAQTDFRLFCLHYKLLGFGLDALIRSLKFSKSSAENCHPSRL